jgi:type IV pilus assembly protein PilO
MNLQFSKKEIFILISGMFMVLVLYFIITITYLNPLKESVLQKEQQLKTEKQLHAAYEKRLHAVPSGEIKSASELYKIIPKEPFTEQLILNFEKAEIVSESTITFMEFGEGNSADQKETAANPDNESDGSSSNDRNGEIVNSMPEGLQKTSVTLSVEAKGYEGLEKFIQVLEESKREVIIESIDFEGPEKSMDYVADAKENILFTIKLSAFYFPMENDSDNQMQIETPAPANKRNPFPTFGDYSEDNLTEQDVSDEVESEETDED